MLANGRTATREQLLRAIETGEHLPDQFLPIGIHRISANRYRALLCTGGHKFKGPGRDSIREALEDRRKLCEQTGVDFVIYGKQTHVKGERPVGWQNAAVLEDGSTTVPVVPGRTVPKDLSAAIRVAPSKPIAAHGGPGGSATVSGRFAAPSAPTEAATTATATPWGVAGVATTEELVYSRRKAMHPEYKLGKKEGKAILGAAMRNAVYSHPYNLLVEDISISALEKSNEGLAPVSIQVTIDGKSINDQFLWSVHSVDHTGLDVYLSGLLMDAGATVTYERIQQLRKLVDDQLAAFRSAVLHKPQIPPPPFATRPAHTTHVQLFLDKVKMSAFTDDQVAQEFAQVYAAEHGVADASSVLWQVIDQCVAARATDLATITTAAAAAAAAVAPDAAGAVTSASSPQAAPKNEQPERPQRSSRASNKSR